MTNGLTADGLSWLSFEVLRRCLAGSAVEPSLATDWAGRLIASGLTDKALVALSIAEPGDERGIAELVKAAWPAVGVDLTNREKTYALLFDLLASAIAERRLPAYDLVLVGMLLAGETFDDPAAEILKVYYQVEDDLGRLLARQVEDRAFDASDPAAWVLAQLAHSTSSQADAS